MSLHLSFLVQGAHLASCARSQSKHRQIRAVTPEMRGRVMGKQGLSWLVAVDPQVPG